MITDQRGRFRYKAKCVKTKTCYILKKEMEVETPEERLWFAVLERAIKDIDNEHHMINSRKWFLKQSPMFEYICDALDVEMKYVVKRMIQMSIIKEVENAEV